ncbi:MAG TPA: hypothetical protein VFR61_05485 [Nitrososphaeraceae archaeon]|nr:hypothetical protein [Nitrososphaeraceae archaeon]
MDFQKNSLLPTTPAFLTSVAIAFSIFICSLASQNLSHKRMSRYHVNSSFVPLTNTDADQVKVNVEYTLEDEKIQNQIVNAVMEVYVSNGTLIRNFNCEWI